MNITMLIILLYTYKQPKDFCICAFTPVTHVPIQQTSIDQWIYLISMDRLCTITRANKLKGFRELQRVPARHWDERRWPILQFYDSWLLLSVLFIIASNEWIMAEIQRTVCFGQIFRLFGHLQITTMAYNNEMNNSLPCKVLILEKKWRKSCILVK